MYNLARAKFRYKQRNLDGRVGIIALSDIQQARDPPNVTKILVKETKLAAGQGQHNTVIGNLLDKFSVIITISAKSIEIRTYLI